MNKIIYQTPETEISILMSRSVLCGSNGGSTEDFGTGTGFSFDLFEEVKPL
ncbi:MAG: hypothetical protein IKX03_06145 [Bacteroidales bacterium]|nr:hypothetical protein [Bacteroidales bacterium]